MNNEKKTLLENQDWEYIIKDLTLYANSRFKFWNLMSEKGVKGLAPEDIAIEAIELVLINKWKWNPEKSDLLTYLKFHVVKGLVANLVKNSEVKKSVLKDINEMSIEFKYSIEDNLNAGQVLKIIEADLTDDKHLLSIFLKLNEGMKRKEICEVLDIDTKEYDNRIRRLKTRLLKMEKQKVFESLKK